MTDEPMEALSALVDGEAKDAGAVAAALALPGSRETIVDFVRLRAEIGADESLPSARLYAEMEEALGRRGPAHRSAPRRLLSALAAAAVLALAALGAASLSQRLHPPADQPPRATRVLQFTPGVDWHEGEAR
jgi:hypothetical protein